MALQTLKTIKNWFRTGLKPTQAQFWDTWDSFRHKSDKVPVGDIEGIDELLDSKTDESDFKTINGESILGSGDISIDGGGSQDLQQVLNKGNNYSTYGQNDYMRLTNQYAPGWQFNEMRLMPGGIRVEKSHGGNTTGIVYGSGDISSLYTRSDYANQTGFKLDTEGLLLKTNISQSGTGIIKSDNLSKLTDYQLPVETTEPSITLVSKVNGIPADINGNVVISLPPVKTFIANINRIGTNEPTVKVIYNDTGATLNLVKTSNAGQFVGTFSSPIFQFKKVLYWVDGKNISEILRLAALGGDTFFFGTATLSSAVTNSYVDINLINAYIKIEIYP
ncbi:hypothetical protein [Flavobacterium sp. ov086]|uniref:hypothetical protein n=1 Tax=Flavobacterium sp. ov086 TaxID=1761785 RepID=UPI000B6F852C|nr:hypothetical protein [Flavobacterium sp. ov086]SNR32716.1 hypothetical protein SAMN04487979_10333 [Flavobacterium sp. ov086]